MGVRFGFKLVYGSCALVLAAAGCGDDGGNTASGTMSGTGTTVTTGITVGSTGDTPTTGSSQSGTTEGGGSVSATGSTTDNTTNTTSTTSTTNSTDATSTTSTTGPDTTGQPGTTGGVMSTGGIPASCGDGQVDPGEECDDGPMNGEGANCNVDCTLNLCGDGEIGPMEECDLGMLNGPDNGCSAECTILASACGNQQAEAMLVPKPIDIIIAIDNSGSMSTEIKGVQDNINNNFAKILEMGGLDYRVIMVSGYGKYTSYRVCIEAPLGGIPMGGCVNPPAQPVNSDRFYHYSVTVSSTNSWCQLLATLKGATKDQFNLAPTGWQQWLRPNSFKIFLEITDDRVSCSYNGKSYNDGNTIAGGMTAATAFDASLQMADPNHFGASPMLRNYNWYSLVGLAYNMPPEKPYGADEPIVTGKCPSGVNGGIGYQTLSKMTNALRFPLCDTTKYDVVFSSIANNVVNDAKIQCDFVIPPPPEGKTLDEESIVVNFTPMGQMDPVKWGQVPSPDMCNAMSFYLQDGKVVLCPEACAAANANSGAKVTVDFTCEPLTPN
jgi:hypothetical protein